MMQICRDGRKSWIGDCGGLETVTDIRNAFKWREAVQQTHMFHEVIMKEKENIFVFTKM